MKKNLMSIIYLLFLAVIFFVPLPNMVINIFVGLSVVALLVASIVSFIQKYKGTLQLWLPSFSLYWCLFSFAIVISVIRMILTAKNPDIPNYIFKSDISIKNIIISAVIFLIVLTVNFILLGTEKERLNKKWEAVKEKGIKEEIEFYGNLDGSIKFLRSSIPFILFIAGVILFGRTLIDNTQFGLVMTVAIRKNLILAMGITLIFLTQFMWCRFICIGSVEKTENETEV